MRGSTNPQAFDKGFPTIVKRGGAVILTPKSLPHIVYSASRQYAAKLGKPIRAPHHTVSARGLLGELKTAEAGILLLTDLDEFKDFEIQILADELGTMRTTGAPVPTVVATVIEKPGEAESETKAARLASVLGLLLLRIDSEGQVEQVKVQAVAPPAVSQAERDLKRVNRHRAKLGMRPLDPVASGWTADDLHIEADLLRRRFGNPKVGWGAPYGRGPHFILPDGRPVWMYRGRHNRVRFYDEKAKQVGPQQANVCPAVAFALANGWREWWGERSNPEFEGGTLARIGPDEVFAKSGSHRARDSVERTLGYRLQTYYSFRRKSSAATSFFIVSKAEFEKIRHIKGVGKARFRPQDSWGKTWTTLPGRRNPWQDRIPGGRADRYSPADFDQVALAQGRAVEMEHTSDPHLATEIAMDHLVEDPKYYEKLRTIHVNPEIAATKARMLAYY